MPKGNDFYIQNLLSQATQTYPFVKQHNPMVVMGKGEGYAETYPVGETGAPLQGGGFSRPMTLPVDRVGVEVYKPNEFTPKDLAAEMLHIDPYAAKTRDQLMSSWTPKQLQTLKKHALDWEATLAEGRPEADAIKNATDSALRGYTVGQWPEEINKALGYSPDQLKTLDSLKMYMITGKEPMSRKDLIEQQINQLPKE